MWETQLVCENCKWELIICVAVCTTSLPNLAFASLVEPKKITLFKMVIKCNFKSSIHLKLHRLSLNLGKQYWREAGVSAGEAAWVFLWLICQTSF